uniref:Uncharacterized protein n=1 Tax=Tetraselmis sp. GSL018 TaxID=582737 RepID=A0A061S4Q4_9CHLO
MDTLEQYRRSAMGRTAFASVGAPPSAELKQLTASSWEVRRRSPGDDSQSWDIAPAGAAPAMKLERLDALQEEASPGGNPIPLLGMPTLVPFLGMSTSSDLAARRGGGEDDDGGGGGFAEAEPEEDEEHQAAAAGEEAQEAARKAFMLQQGGDFDSSSDDDSSNAGSASASEASGRQRLQIKIREAGAPVASPQTGTDALRAAAMNLSLAPPGQFQGLSKRRTTGAESAKASSTGNNSGDFSSESSSPQRTLQSAEAPVAAPPSFPAVPGLPPAPPAPPPPRQQPGQAAPPAQGGHSSLELFKSAVTDMENGAWDSGAALVARAMERADAEAQGAGLDEGKKQQRLGLMAQYLAAMLLLNHSRQAEGMAAHRARLLRFTAALGLEARHKVPLQQDSVKKNIAAGNYGYAASVLEDLISKAIATGSGTEHMSELQTLLERCDAEGGSNASVPQDEDPAVFSEILATASVPEDVRAMVRQLHEG